MEFTHITRGHKMAKLLWKTVCHFHIKINIQISYNSTLSYLSKGSKATCSHKTLHMNIHRNFIHNTSYLAITSTVCSSTCEQLNKLYCIYMWLTTQQKNETEYCCMNQYGWMSKTLCFAKRNQIQNTHWNV